MGRAVERGSRRCAPSCCHPAFPGSSRPHSIRTGSPPTQHHGPGTDCTCKKSRSCKGYLKEHFLKYHQWCQLVCECMESAATALLPECCCWIENAHIVELGVVCLLALLLHSWLEHITSQSAQISHRRSRTHIFAVHVFSFLVAVF